MKLKFMSKNNMGIVMTLILVVLLSQSNIFHYFMDNHLGRLVLLVFVISIAYTNKMLGLAAVLFISIWFNTHDSNNVHSYNYYGSNYALFEGFDVSGNDPSGNNVAVSQDTINKLKEKVNAIQTEMNNRNANNTNNTSLTTASSSAISGTGTGTETFKGREGFNMTDRELNILRGKSSNSVPVFNKYREQSDDVSPTDKSVFSGDYASF